MPQTEMMVPFVKGISRPVQAGICLKLAGSRVLDGKHALIPQCSMQGKRLPIAVWLLVVGTRREVAHE